MGSSDFVVWARCRACGWAIERLFVWTEPTDENVDATILRAKEEACKHRALCPQPFDRVYVCCGTREAQIRDSNRSHAGWTGDVSGLVYHEDTTPPPKGRP